VDTPTVERDGRFWVLVDLKAEHPEFYVMPEWWIRDNIHATHEAYLLKHKGVRSKAYGSTHHAISHRRVEQWKGRWAELGILPPEEPTSR